VEYRGFPATRQRETISQSLLRTILTVKNFDDGVQMHGEHGAVELIATVFALRETAGLTMNLVKSRE